MSQPESRTGTEILTVTQAIIKIFGITNIAHNHEFQNRYDPLKTGDSTHTCRRHFALLLCWLGYFLEKMRILIFWDVTWCRWVSTAWCSEGNQCLHLQMLSGPRRINLAPLKTLRYIPSKHQEITTQHHIPEDLKPQHHHRGNVWPPWKTSYMAPCLLSHLYLNGNVFHKYHYIFYSLVQHHRWAYHCHLWKKQNTSII